MKEYANIIYWRKVSKIGGVETFIYELAKKYDYDLALYYNSADENQIKRLIKLIPCVPYIKQKIKCKRIFVCNDTEILDTVKYEEAIQMIHGMYKTNKIEPNLDPRITKRMAFGRSIASFPGGRKAFLRRILYHDCRGWPECRDDALRPK